MLFAASHPEEVVIGPIVISLLAYLGASLIQLLVLWRRSRTLSEQLAGIQNDIAARTIRVVQANVYRKA
jgi:hypothetical protein